MVWIWRGWHKLTHERQWIPSATGPARPGRIPWSAAMAYADRQGYGEEELIRFERGLAAMDEAFIAWWSEDQERRARAKA